MKMMDLNRWLLVAVLAATTISFTSCGSDGDTDTPGTGTLGNSYFTATVGDKEYKYPCATTNGSNAPAGKYAVMAFTSAGSDYDKGYGIYSGGVVTATHTLQGEGEYTITDTETFVTNLTKKLVTFGVTLGSGTQIGYLFNSQADSGKAIVTIENGKYHITVSNPVTLKWKLNTGTPAQAIPATIKLTLTNGYVK